MVLKGNTNSFYTITSKVTFEFLLWSINDLFINLVKVDLQMALVKPLYLKSSSQVCQRNCSLRWNWTLKLYLSPDFFVLFFIFFITLQPWISLMTLFFFFIALLPLQEKREGTAWRGSDEKTGPQRKTQPLQPVTPGDKRLAHTGKLGSHGREYYL